MFTDVSFADYANAVSVGNQADFDDWLKKTKRMKSSTSLDYLAALHHQLRVVSNKVLTHA